MKKTNLLRDEPAHEDAFGAHQRIADELVRIIKADDGDPPPRSVGLLGDWGSGKSSVIYMMRDKLNAIKESPPRFHVFIYDAWAHQGDELRRAFLDTLIESLGGVLKESDKKQLKKRVWQKEETTETKSQQMLRRHGKILLVSLLLSPIFLRFYQSPPVQWDDLAKCIWNYVTFIGIFLPFLVFLALFLIKISPFHVLHRWFLGANSSDKLQDIQISSVFFQRTEGHIDIKTTTNPSDSIREFNNIFREICQIAIDGGRKMVFVIDNIDRLDHDEARSFWATMQSFLDRALWSRTEDARKVFYIVPFSPLAIKSAFDAKDNVIGASQSFIDKTFDLSIHVSPPIQVDLRGYMFSLLRSAFPDHDAGCLEAVRDLYDYHRSVEGKLGQAGDAETSRRTPRQMKLFVNQLVALYRLRGEELALETMAAYLLSQNQINEGGLAPQEQLTPQQLFLLPSEPDVVQQLAAVHFGVSLSAAAQVVLFEPIRNALGSKDLSALKRLSGRSGFADVLKLAIGARDGEASVLDALQAAIAVNGLPGADGVDHNQIWNALLNNLRHAKRLGIVDESAAEGLRLIYQHLHESQKSGFISALKSGLSKKWVSLTDQRPQTSDESDQIFAERMGLTRSFVKCAQILAEMKLLDALGEIHLITYPGFATRLVEEVAIAKNWRDLTRALRLGILSGDPAKAIVDRSGIEPGPSVPYDFVRVAEFVKGYTPDWSIVANLAIAKLSSSTSDVSQANASLRLVLSLAALHPKLGVEKSIQGLFADGTLAVTLQQEADDEFSGAIVAAFLVFAPATDPSSLLLPNGRPAAELVSILQGENVDAAVLDDAVETILKIEKSNAALSSSILYPKAQKLGAAVVSRLIMQDHQFTVSKFMLVRGQKFISSLAIDVPVYSFYEELQSSISVLKDLNKQEVEEGNSYTYLRVAATSWGGKSIALRNRLRKYVDNAPVEKWVKAILENSDQSNLMFTLSALKRLGVQPELGASASDAVTRIVEQAVMNNSDINSRTADVVAALAPDVKSNLSPKIWQLLAGSRGFEPIASVLAVIPDVVVDTSSRTLTELLNTVFSRALSSNRSSLIRWISGLLQQREGEVQHALPAIGEFRSRVSTQVRTAGLPRELRAELKQLLALLPKPTRRKKP